jgi:hypothetical protein
VVEEPGRPLDVADRLAIHELLGLYGHLIDERRWGDLGLVFVDDVVYDATDMGMPVTRSLADLVELWCSDQADHPLAHHATNIVVTVDPAGATRVWSKGIGVGRGGRVGSVVYRDVVVRTAVGWRLAERVVTRRRPD